MFSVYQFVFYFILLALFSLAVLRLRFFKMQRVPQWITLTAFLLKCAIGFYLCYYFKVVQHGRNDYYHYNRYAWDEYHFFKADPSAFFQELTLSSYGNGFSNVFGSYNSYWNDLAENLIIKPIALLNVFSHGNFYINTLPFLFFGFIGAVAISKIYQGIFQKRNLHIFCLTLFLPSLILFTSSIHKDMLCFSLLGIFCYCIYRYYYHTNKKKYLIAGGISFILLFLFRNYIPVAIVPFILVFLIFRKRDVHQWKPYLIMFVLIFAGIFVLQAVSPKISPIRIISQKQWSFFNKKGETDVAIDSIFPTSKSFLLATPEALSLALVRPVPRDVKGNPPILILMIELWLILALIIYFFLKRDPPYPNHSFIFFTISFSILLFIIIGYSVPNLAAILRYKSIYLPYVLLPFAAIVKFPKFK